MAVRRQRSREALLDAHSGIRLDVGCGENKQRGFLGMDVRRLPGVDIVHDLEKTPWPLKDGSVAVVVLSHVWEHIKPWLTLSVMAEIHRVCLHDALVMIAGPYGIGFRYQQDPTHCNPSNEATWAYFDSKHPSGLWNVYKPPTMHIEQFTIVPAVPGDRDFEVALRVCKERVCDHV